MSNQPFFLPEPDLAGDIDTWAGRVFEALESYDPPRYAGDWKEWGSLLVSNVSALQRSGAPRTEFYDDWRSWAGAVVGIGAAR